MGRARAGEGLRLRAYGAVSAELYGEVCDLLRLGHSKGDETPGNTLNRTFEKCVRMTLGDDRVRVPPLSPANVRITLEDRPTTQLAELTNRAARDLSLSPYPPGALKRFKRRVRKSRDIPVIVAHYLGRDYLIDGNRRVAYWLENGAPTVRAYVVYVA